MKAFGHGGPCNWAHGGWSQGDRAHGCGPRGRGPRGGGGGGRHGHHGQALGEVLWSLFGRERRVRRGDVRAAILALLAEGSYNGYQIIGELERRSDGTWRPSPGSVYPTLQQLEDEGLVAAEASGTGRLFSLTEAGRAYVAEHSAEIGTPWDTSQGAGGGQEQIHALWDEMKQVAHAAVQVARAGDEAQIERARKIVADSRRALYRILAEDEPQDD